MVTPVNCLYRKDLFGISALSAGRGASGMGLKEALGWTKWKRLHPKRVARLGDFDDD